MAGRYNVISLKRLLAFTSLFIVLALGGRMIFSHKETASFPAELKRVPATITKPNHKPERRPFTAKQIAAVRGPASDWVRPLPIMRRKALRQPGSDRLNLPVETKNYRGMENERIAIGIRALKVSDYAPSMGEFLREINGMVYFRQNPNQPSANAANVVYDQANDKVYALSSVLKVQEASEAVRLRISQTGLPEYYYSSPAKTLYLSSSNAALFQDYQNLEAQGYKVSIEIMKEQHRSR